MDNRYRVGSGGRLGRPEDEGRAQDRPTVHGSPGLGLGSRRPRRNRSFDPAACPSGAAKHCRQALPFDAHPAQDAAVVPDPRHLRFRISLLRSIWLASIVLHLGVARSTTVLAQSADRAQLAAAFFECDVTPPMGHPLCGGWIRPVEAVDDPLLAKGVVLAQGGRRAVICAVDWCLLQTEAHELFCRTLANAVDVSRDHVTVHTVHQHNAPIADARAQRLLDDVADAPLHVDGEFLEAVTDRLATAAKMSLNVLQPVTTVGYGKARVERFASNRRVRHDDGTILVRYSSTRDPVLQAAPEGLIDPLLRTVTLFNASQPLVRLHYYATHPMSYYGDGRVTSDTVGLAREQLQREEGVPQVYFTGCAGNITAGKYNDGSPEARVALTQRIYDAMKDAIADTRLAALKGMQWRTTEVELVPRSEPQWSEVVNRAALASTNASTLDRLKSALNLAWLEQLKESPAISISSLSLGPVTLLHLPAECFIEYQLHAQELRPNGFVAVAAYGESGPGYVCTDLAFGEGGYEPTMSRVGPPSERRLKAGIARLLKP